MFAAFARMRPGACQDSSDASASSSSASDAATTATVTAFGATATAGAARARGRESGSDAAPRGADTSLMAPLGVLGARGCAASDPESATPRPDDPAAGMTITLQVGPAARARRARPPRPRPRAPRARPRSDCPPPTLARAPRSPRWTARRAGPVVHRRPPEAAREHPV